MITLGYDNPNHELIKLDIKQPVFLNIMSKEIDKRAEYLSHFLFEIDKNYSEKEVCYTFIDVLKIFKSIPYKNNIEYTYESNKAIAIAEVFKDEVFRRYSLMKKMECDRFEDLEYLIRNEKPDYKNPPTLYLIIHNIESLRILIGDDGKNYVDYFDSLLRHIIVYGKFCGVGLIFSSFNALTNNFPKLLIPYLTHKIGYDFTSTHINDGYFTNVDDSVLYQDKIYYQEKFSYMKCLDYTFELPDIRMKKFKEKQQREGDY